MTNKTDTAQQEAAEAVGLPKVSQGDLDKAKREGVLEAAKEKAKDAYNFATDGNLMGEIDTSGPPPGFDDVNLLAPLLGLPVKELEAQIAEDGPVAEEKVWGLLALERNGQNRTDYVKAMMKRLGIKADELPGGGPPYTNDATPTTAL